MQMEMLLLKILVILMIQVQCWCRLILNKGGQTLNLLYISDTTMNALVVIGCY